MKNWELGSISRKIHMENFFAINCRGEGRHRSCGVALMWKADIKVEVRRGSRNFIDYLVSL